jgi:hypothetical protein
MSKMKMAAALAIIVIVLAASFFVGSLFTRYGLEERYQSGIIPKPSGMPEPLQSTPTAKSAETAATQERMVIYNGFVSLETHDVEGTVDRVRTIAENYGGYVAGTTRSNVGNQTVADITIRVPQDKFHTTIKKIETYGKILDERTTSEDVTERYIDLKARLKNLQMVEQSLVELLSKATTVDEILKVQQELGRVRGDIDSLQGQINYLERNVEMSVITVSLREPPTPFTPLGMNWGETFETAIRGFFTVVSGLIILVASVLPLLVIIGLPAYYLHRRKQAKEHSK